MNDSYSSTPHRDNHSVPPQQSATPHHELSVCPVGLRDPYKRVPRMSLGYRMTYKALCDYSTKRGFGHLETHNQISRSFSLISKEVKGGTLLHWVKYDRSGRMMPFIAIATNSKSILIDMGTPERIQALKLTLEMDDDPTWELCRNI